MAQFTCPKLHIDGQWFKDENNRIVLLRGVNLGGDSKVPYPNGGTNYPTDFSDHKSVSFIGRPFPIDEADEHFYRLKSWGFNVLRLLVTWEAVEHSGPGIYDTAYLDYYTKLCKIAGDYGFYIFVDFHQDVWSRMTGGDGAPCWLFEKIGIDYTKLSKANAALVMQHEYNYTDPRIYQEEKYPSMCWGYNRKYAGNGIMWTLFFAGKFFTPDFKIEGVNVQDYMQNHYFDAQLEVAKRVRDFPNVIGFDSLNEPFKGWIGIEMNDRHLISKKKSPALPGYAWSPIDALFSSHGFPVDIPLLGLSIMKLSMVPKKIVKMNKESIPIWIHNDSDPFIDAGAWKIVKNEKGTSFQILKNDFFQYIQDPELKQIRMIDFNKDCMMPFINRIGQKIQEINPDWMIFAEKDAEEAVFFPPFVGPLPKNMVNATHWYDTFMNGMKTFRWFSFDVVRMKLLLGMNQIQKSYEYHLGTIKKASKVMNCPTLIGECGIQMDLDRRKAFNTFNYNKKAWKWHNIAFDTLTNAMNTLCLNFTIWNYTAANSNKWGDLWNQEDLSIFSKDQQTDPSDINSGGRGLDGLIKPFPHFTQGIIKELKFNRRTGICILQFEGDISIKQPTVLYLPTIHYPNGYTYESIGVPIKITEDRKNQIISIFALQNGNVKLIMKRK